MRGIVLAWAVGLGIMTWREAQKFGKPPVPGTVLAASVVFAALAFLAEYPAATRAATLAAWGFDVAVLFEAGPKALTSTQGFGGPAQPATPTPMQSTQPRTMGA